MERSITNIFYSKDARLPEMLQRAMAAEAEASREARAKVIKLHDNHFYPVSRYLKVIAADGEMRASKALREASQIIEQSPAALQLRYLQVMFPQIVKLRGNKSNLEKHKI